MNKIIIVVLFTLVSIMWGTTWMAMNIATETIPPLFATGMRFLLASPLLIILSYFTKSPLLFPSGQRWFQTCITIFYFTIPFTLMLYGGSYVSASVASIIFSNMPVVVLLISHFYLKQKLFFIQKVGACIALCTLCILLLIELKLEHFSQWKGICALILALFFHAMIYTEYQKQCCVVSVLTFNALPSLISGILLAIISWFVEQPHINIFSYRSILSVFYLGNFSGVCGILSYFYLQKKVSAFYASTVFVIFPFIAGILEYYIYQHKISSLEIWFIFPLMVGILLTLFPKKFLKNKCYIND